MAEKCLLWTVRVTVLGGTIWLLVAMFAARLVW